MMMGGVCIPPDDLWGTVAVYAQGSYMVECVRVQGSKVVPQRPPSSWPGSRGWSSCLAVASPEPCVHSGTTLGGGWPSSHRRM